MDMELVLGLAVIVLAVLNVKQYAQRRSRHQTLSLLGDKLAAIVEGQTSEKLLLATAERDIRRLLIQINRLLDQKQKTIADYAKTKLELRKMISNMSHDLKTPLTVILGYVEKLELEPGMLETERADTVRRLHRKTLSLIDLIRQFFDLARLESGDADIPLGRIHINEICRKNVLDFYGLLQSERLKVEIDIPEQPLYVLGNEEALNRILSNLISNAIRYGRDGGVFGLTLRDEGDHVAVVVWDQGKGIAEIEQERVFERLYTLEDSRNPDFQGSGLGLSITKRLMEAMRGSIRLRSEPYKRTAFTCTFKKVNY